MLIATCVLCASSDPGCSPEPRLANHLGRAGGRYRAGGAGGARFGSFSVRASACVRCADACVCYARSSRGLSVVPDAKAADKAKEEKAAAEAKAKALEDGALAASA